MHLKKKSKESKDLKNQNNKIFFHFPQQNRLPAAQTKHL